VGSFLTIEFGNPRLNSVGISQGEFHLWVYGASWELRERTRVITSSTDDLAGMLDGVRILEDAFVWGAEFDRNRMALGFRFAGDVDLSITPLGDPDMEEWLLFLGDGSVITAGPGKAVAHESASDFRQLLNGQ
jgi:hypothetical protein